MAQGGARVGHSLRGAMLVAVLVGVALGGCAIPEPPPEILDGLSIGGAAGCGACDAPQTAPNCGACTPITALAVRHVDETWPGHPDIGAMSFHGESWYPGENGDKILHTRSGSVVIAVVTFVDGTRHAVEIYCGVGGCR